MRRGLVTSAGASNGGVPPTTPLWSRQWVRRGIGLGLGLAALAGFSAAAYTSYVVCAVSVLVFISC
jgi:hypothetical protein